MAANVTLAQVARLAGVQRPSVSNWRRRHADFPQPNGGTAGQPTFDADEIAEWLDQRPAPADGHGRAQTYGQAFRAALHSTAPAAHGGDDFLDSTLRLLALRADQPMASPSEAQPNPTAPAGLAPPVALADLFPGEDAELAAYTGEVDRLLRTLGPAEAAEELIATAQRGRWSGTPAETPAEVCELIRELVVELLGDLNGLRISDLAAGPGRLLATLCAGATPRSIRAIEPDLRYRAWLRLRLFCHGHWNVTVNATPQPDEPDADLVVVDPPFQPGEHDQAEDHPLTWVHRAARRLAPDGVGFAVVPEWTLTRHSSTRRLPAVLAREELVRHGCLRAIIQLPRHLHPASTGTDFAVLVLGSPDSPRPAHVLVCDASAVRAHHPEGWVARTARLVTGPTSGRAGQPCRAVPVPELLASRSYLPAHLLVAEQAPEEHTTAVVRARQAALAAHSGATDPLPILNEIGVTTRPSPARHRTVGELIRGGQLVRLRGHRIPAGELGRVGQRVIGREELLGESPLGRRRIEAMTLGRYPAATITEPGDVVILAGEQLRVLVDDAGGSVLLTPAQGLRIPGYVRHSGLFRDEPQRAWIGPYALAALLGAARNATRTGPRVRAVGLNQLDIPALTPAEYDHLNEIALRLTDLADQARRQAATLDALHRQLATGLADGGLTVRSVPPSSTPRH